MKKIIILLLIALLMAALGCHRLAKTMDSWMGANVDQLIASWGAPDSRMDLRDGGQVLTWISIRSNAYGVWQCRKSFTADRNGTLIKWSYSGC